MMILFRRFESGPGAKRPVARRWSFPGGPRIAAALAGFAALAWFLVRVVPKPSRAAYPCQRAAFPLASSFVIWVASLAVSCLSFTKARHCARLSRYRSAALFAVAAVLGFGWFLVRSSDPSYADNASTDRFVIESAASQGPLVTPGAVVSIVRSGKAAAGEIDSLEIGGMVRQAVELAGGLDSLVRDGCTVALKPNLIATAVLDDDYFPTADILPRHANAVTTDVRVIQAVVDRVRELNPHGRIIVIEGSGIGGTRENMRRMGWLELRGVDEFVCLDEACGAWRDRDAEELVEVSLPEGKALYAAARNRYWLNRAYRDADVLISLPVLKTHSNAAVTGAVKNVGIGATPVNIYGSSAPRPWRVDAIDHGGVNYANLHDWIHDYYLCRPADFAVMDGLTGMENGPTPVKSDRVSLKRKNTRCILASRDPIALDAVESLIVQVDPKRVRHLAALHNDGAGCADPAVIRVEGVRVDQVKDRYSNLSAYARYSDFTAPEASVKFHRFTGDSLRLGLTADAGVRKVEIEVDGIRIDPIVVSNFGDFTAPLGKRVNDPSAVRLFVYDEFLNCAILSLGPSSVRRDPEKPASVYLLRNYPNPFNSGTVIRYRLSAACRGSLEVFDPLGRRVAVPAAGEFRAGDHEVLFDAAGLAGGVYLVRLTAEEGIETVKMTVLK